MQGRWKWALLGILLIPCVIIAYPGVGDLHMYFAVAKYAAAGEWSRIYGINENVGRFFYGPFSLITLSWMAPLSYKAVTLLYIFFHSIAYGLFWWGLVRLFPSLGQRSTVWAFVFVWIVSIKSIHASFQTHNIQLMIMAALLWSYHWLKSDRAGLQFLAGFVPMLLGLIKVFPLFMVAVFLLSRKRAVWHGVLTGAVVGIGMPTLLYGMETSIFLHNTFLGNLGNFHNYAPLLHDAVTLSLASGFATWFSPFVGMEAAMLLYKIIGGLFCGAILIFAVRKPLTPGLFALAIAVMGLVNSSTRPDYFIFFVPAFAYLALTLSEEKRFGYLFPVGVSFALLCLIVEWVLGSRELGHQLELMRLPVIGMIVLVFAMAHAYLKPARPEV